MNSKSGGIYTITSKINGKRYIGSSVVINRRWMEHKRKLKNNKHVNPHLQNHYNKYGENDLIFTVVEVVQRDSLNLKDYKKLLTDIEQTYLDNWGCCEFNCLKTATSRLGHKEKDKRYYSYNNNRYNVKYVVFGEQYGFGVFNTEEQAKEQVSLIESMNEQEQFDFYIMNYKGKNSQHRKRNKNTKGYYYLRKINRWVVAFIDLNSKKKVFYGSYKTEEEAQARAIEVKKQLGSFDL